MGLCLTVTLALMVIGGTLRLDLPDAAPGADRPAGLDSPKLILDGTDYGRMFPTFADIDGDGKIDLVVGVTGSKGNGGGRLLVYLNQRTRARPNYGKPAWLHETVPTARITDG
jgi:FG-GAP repeat